MHSLFSQKIPQILAQLDFALQGKQCAWCLQQTLNPVSTHQVCNNCIVELGILPPQPLAQFSSQSIYCASYLTPKVKQTLYGLKFSNQAKAAWPLTQLMHYYWQHLTGKGASHTSMVVPIPAHGSRQHLHSIFKPLAHLNNTPYMPNLLSWQRPVEKQHALSTPAQRHHNVHMALQANPQALKTPPATIWLVDDILTTGATVLEGKRALQAAFPQAQINILTLCHVPFSTQTQH